MAQQEHSVEGTASFPSRRAIDARRRIRHGGWHRGYADQRRKTKKGAQSWTVTLYRMALGTPTDILDSLFCRNEGDVSRLAGRGRLSSDASADRGLRAGKAAKAAGQRLGDVSRTSGITVPPLTSHLDDSAQACPITAVVKLTPITADVARCRRFASSMSNGPVNRPPSEALCKAVARTGATDRPRL